MGRLRGQPGSRDEVVIGACYRGIRVCVCVGGGGVVLTQSLFTSWILRFGDSPIEHSYSKSNRVIVIK